MKFEHFRVYLGMICCTSLSGIILIAGTIGPYILSYYHSKNSSFGISDIILISLIAQFFQCINYVIATQLMLKFNELYIIVCGFLLGVICFFCISYIENSYLFVISFGFFSPIIGAYCFMPSIGLARKIIGDDQLTIIKSIGVACFSLSPFLLGLGFTLIINPDNEPPTHEEHNGKETIKMFSSDIYDKFPSTFRYLTVIIFCIGIAGILLLFVRNVKLNNREKYTIGLKGLLCKYSFWYLFFLGFLKLFYYFFIINMYKALGLIYIKDDFFMAYVSGFGFGFCSLVRVISGYVLKKVSWRSFMLIETILEILSAVFYFNSVESKYLFAAMTIIIFTLTGTSFLTVWVIVDQIYPEDKWVFSAITMTNSLSLAAVMLFTSTLIPSLGYQTSFYIIAGMQVAALVMIWKIDHLEVHKSKVLIKADEENK